MYNNNILSVINNRNKLLDKIEKKIDNYYITRIFTNGL